MLDEWRADLKKAERTFFWSVLTTLAPEFVEELVLDVRRQRLGAAQERLLQPRQINVAPEWVEPLLSQPLFPSKISIFFLLTFLILPREQPRQPERAGAAGPAGTEAPAGSGTDL